MKFQLITSASALLLSTVPAALAGVTQYKEYAEDIQGQVGNRGLDRKLIQQPSHRHRQAKTWKAKDMIELGNDFNNAFVAIPNPVAGDIPNEIGKLKTYLRDINNDNDNAFVAIPNPFAGDSAAFRNGQRVGVRQAQNTWERLGGTCRTAWRSYPNAINIVIQRLQRARQSDRNQGRIAGLRQQLQRRMRECNGRIPNPPRPNGRIPNPRNPQVCIRFGDEAARRIAWDFCNGPLLTGSRDSWRRDCRDVAINTCKGQVATEVQNQCGLPRNTRTLRQLQDKCNDKVDSMIGNSRRFTEEEMMLS